MVSESRNLFRCRTSNAVQNTANDARARRQGEAEQAWTLSDGTTRAVAAAFAPAERDGNIMLVDSDLVFPTPGQFPLSLTRYYNSFEPDTGPLGHGWELTPTRLSFTRPAYFNSTTSGGTSLDGLREGRVLF